MPTPQPKEVTLPWPTNYVGGVAYALAKELQLLNGGPETKLMADLGVVDTTMYVISTFGFPESGWLKGGGHMFRYTSKSETYFTLDPDDPGFPKAFAVPSGTLFLLVTYKVLPSRYDWSAEDQVVYT